jgi:hypothetical protein
MRRRRCCSGNKPIAADGLGSAVIAIFAEHSTPICGDTIIPYVEQSGASSPRWKIRPCAICCNRRTMT